MDCTNRWRASIQCHSTLWRSSSKGFAECCRTMINMPSKSDSCGFKATRVRYWRSAIRASISFQKHCTTSASINGLLQPTSGIFQRSAGGCYSLQTPRIHCLCSWSQTLQIHQQSPQSKLNSMSRIFIQSSQ